MFIHIPVNSPPINSESPYFERHSHPPYCAKNGKISLFLRRLPTFCLNFKIFLLNSEEFQEISPMECVMTPPMHAAFLKKNDKKVIFSLSAP